MSVTQLAVTVPVTQETIEDEVEVSLTIAVVLTQTPPRGRYRRVWQDGYWSAIGDIRAGRLPGFTVDEKWQRRPR